jgi:MYXO-CTERM domain-containing protein
MRIVPFLLVAALSAPGLAAADVPPPGLDECNGKSAGDACEIAGQSGACQRSQCGRIDYSQTPPGSVTYECVLCVAGGAPANAAEEPDQGWSSSICSVSHAKASPAALAPIAIAMLLTRRALRRRRAARAA